MLVKEISEQHIQDIGHAFGYYDYGEEKGMASWFRDKEAVVTYICGFVRCVLTDGFLHTTSERGEGYIAYKLPWQKVSFKAARILLRGMLQSMSLGELFHFARMLSKAGPSLEDVLNKEKKPCIYVGMVCVREAYQGQGYMRKVMDLAFAEGMKEGRQGSMGFNLNAYKANNPDLVAVFGDDNVKYYEHYISQGRAEGRVAV